MNRPPPPLRGILDPAPQHVMLCGRCERPDCRAWFTMRWPFRQFLSHHYGGSDAARYCSKRCARNMQEKRRRHRDRDEFVAQATAACATAAELCPTCWCRPRATGDFQQVLCSVCMTSVESMCRGKARRGTSGNADRVAGARGSWTGRNMDAYLCRFCGWWHVGGAVNRRRFKQLTFLVDEFLARAPAELVERLRHEYTPGRGTKYGPRVRLIK